MKPKYLKKKKSSGLKWVLIFAVVAVCLIIVAIIHTNHEKVNENPGYETQPDQISTETTEATKATTPNKTEEESGNQRGVEFKNGEIQTPYLMLNYPESFEDLLLVINSCQDPYVLEFYAVLPEKMELRIFDLCLGTGSAGNIGVVVTDAGEVPVNLTVYQFNPDETWSDGEIDTVLAMQEATNELISALNIVNESEENKEPVLEETPEETTIVNFIEIETPYCVLQYPAMWGNWLRTSHNESESVYSVEFYCRFENHEQLLMFTVLFGGDDGEQLGVVTNAAGVTVPVNIEMNAPSEEGLREEELNILYSMQEAINVLIQKLPLQ